jgi:hypothetical protein
MHMESLKTPLPVKILSVLLFLFGLFAFFGSVFLWGQGFILNFPVGVNLAFPIADILVNTPASIIAAVGLWKLKGYGYPAAQFVAGFYVYASVVIISEVAQGGSPYLLEIVLPQIAAVVVAFILVFYLWRVRDLFSN